MNRKQKLTAGLLIPALILFIAGILFFYYRFDPGKNIMFPKCLFHLITGLECPGCGSQRALHQLLSGNIAEAFRYNALAVVSIPYLMLFAILALWKKRSRSYTMRERLGRCLSIIYHGKAIYIILLIIIIFWIARNFSTAF